MKERKKSFHFCFASLKHGIYLHHHMAMLVEEKKNGSIKIHAGNDKIFNKTITHTEYE